MQQLKMYWKAVPSEYPENSGEWTYRTYNGTAADAEAWTEICRDGLLGPKDTSEIFTTCMLQQPAFRPESLFFVIHDGRPVATIAALTDENHVGLIHMVGALPSCRGKGVGSLLNRIALAHLWESGCDHAFLTTDEFRVPAVKSYLKAGFVPVNCDADMEFRWTSMLRFLGLTGVPFVDENGKVLKYLNEV